MSLWNFLASFFPQSPQQPPPAHTHPTTPPPPPPVSRVIMDPTYHQPRILPQSIHDCWLTAIEEQTPSDDSHYIYTVTFRNDCYEGVCHVRASLVSPRTRQDLADGAQISIPADENSRAVCTFGDLVGADERNEVYLRKMSIRFRGKDFGGYVYVPFAASEAQDYGRQVRQVAHPSIEPPEVPIPPRRTVEFLDPIRTDRKIRTEVWSFDGQTVYAGGSTVLKEKVKDGRKYLTIQAPVRRGEYKFLVGDVGDGPWARCGRFQEVDDPREKAAKVFTIPRWVESE